MYDSHEVVKREGDLFSAFLFKIKNAEAITQIN